MILVKEAGSVTLFASRMKKSYAQVSQLINRSLESKTGKPKELGSKQAREMEDVFGLERGWMDHEKLDQEAQVFKQLPPEVRAWILKTAIAGNQDKTHSQRAIDATEAKSLEWKGPERRKGEEDRRQVNLGFDPERRHFYPAPNFKQKQSTNTDRRRKKSE